MLWSPPSQVSPSSPEMDGVVSVLFVPGDQPALFEKAARVAASAICLDLEDSVPEDRKAAARRNVAASVAGLSAAHTVFVRVNGCRSGHLEEDLAAVVGPGVSGIGLAKVEDATDVLRTHYYLEFLEFTRGLPPGTLRLLLWIESARGLSRAEAIVSASSRVFAASLGVEDLAADLGISVARGSAQVDAARARLVPVCRANDVIPLDAPIVDYRDLAWLVEDTRRSRELGYDGRYCIHPSQVSVVNQEYRPTPEQIEWARAVLAAYESATARGVGVIGLEGTLVERPVAERAHRTLRRANLA